MTTASPTIDVKELVRRAKAAVADAFGFDAADMLPEEYEREDEGEGDYLISVSRVARDAPPADLPGEEWFDPRPRPPVREWWQVRLRAEDGEPLDIKRRGYI